MLHHRRLSPRPMRRPLSPARTPAACPATLPGLRGRPWCARQMRENPVRVAQAIAWVVAKRRVRQQIQYMSGRSACNILKKIQSSRRLLAITRLIAGTNPRRRAACIAAARRTVHGTKRCRLTPARRCLLARRGTKGHEGAFSAGLAQIAPGVAQRSRRHLSRKCPSAPLARAADPIPKHPGMRHNPRPPARPASGFGDVSKGPACSGREFYIERQESCVKRRS